MQNFKLKTDVIFGSGSIECLRKLDGKQAFIVADEMMQTLGFVDRITNVLSGSGICCDVFTDVSPDPDIKMVTRGLEKMASNLPDVILAVGGGSVIDTAKGILYTYAKMQKDVTDLPKLITIPTTSGTGSEVTAFSVITVNDEKLCLVDEVMTPDVAIVDPEFVKSVPASVTAETGLDALSHAIEAYVSTDASDFTDALAEKAIKLLFDHLVTIYRDGSNMEAREKVHNASCMAGIAFTNASLGITHSMAHAIGGLFHLPHGRAIGIMLPHVITYNAELTKGGQTSAAEKYAQLARLIGLPASNIQEGCQHFIRAIQVLLSELSVRLAFREYHVDKELYQKKLSTIATLALADNCTPTNPRQPKEADLVELAKKAY